MKKFYKQAEAGTAPGGYTVRLDGKNIKTPLQHPYILPTESLACVIADEWNRQEDEIKPQSMPFSQLANTMIDKAAGSDRRAMEEEVLKYAGSDLLCYFASHPGDLVSRHEKLWRPLLSWLKETHGITLEAVSGIRYLEQSQKEIKKFARIVMALDPAQFTVMQAVMGVTGSAVLALAFVSGKITPEEAYEAACVDEIYQLEKWGEDMLARRKLDFIKAELAVAGKFLELVKTSG